MREVRVKREHLAKTHTLGHISVVEGDAVITRAWVLELPDRSNEPQTSCVPPGRYPLVYEFSPAFNTYLYELKDVPGRSECKIHASNYVSQLRGCLAPGLGVGDLNQDGTPDVLQSKRALAMIHEALAGITKTWITIEQ